MKAGPAPSTADLHTPADGSLPHPAASPERDPALDQLAEVVRNTFDYMPAVLGGYMAGVAVIALLFWGIAPLKLILPWAAAFALLCLVRLLTAQRFDRAAPGLAARGSWADWRRWGRRANLGTLVGATLWGLTGWVYYGHGTGLQQTGLIVIIYTFCVVSIPVLSVQRRLYLGFVALGFMPLVVRIALVGDLYHYQLAGELVVIIGLTTLIANTYWQVLQRAIDLKRQADALAVQLRVETRAADAARREAEIANRAKTQFFAAASHDLRQPLHAMGLFAEALRVRVHEPEVAQLVNSINESVDALEGLFSELLDITRIDTGGIDVYPEHFTMESIFRKLRLHFESTAFEKGLVLRLRGGRHRVHSDPLLVERVMRNLVSNAIRYTAHGSVLASARRRGDRVLLQVWDTGVGIAPEESARIFDEFYQVPRASTMARDQRRGLGLGLAIVKRLAGLMDAPLSLRSTPGRGTVFTLGLPRGKAASALPPSSAGNQAPHRVSLRGELIVVVEDEPAVLGGLEVLLRAWGATLALFDSVAGVAAWAETCDTAVVRPCLLIVDYRLENGRTGVEAIELLRRRFGAELPAIVVTGSVMSGHEVEAHEKNFHVLIKPVLPTKLRAMIAFKLGARPS